MGLLNVDSIINDSTFLSSTKKFISALDSSTGEPGTSAQPKYVYPNDIDRQNAANYMIIYIYDNKENLIEFQPIATQATKSAIQNNLIQQLTDCISVDLTDKSKEALRNYKQAVLGKLENWVKGLFDGFDFNSILGDFEFETPEWVKNVGDFLTNNQLTRGIKNLVDAIDLPQLPDFDISEYIDIGFDKTKLENIVSQLKNAQTSSLSGMESEVGKNFDLVTSIVLPLPTNGISYESKIGIEAASTKTAQTIKNVVDSFLAEGSVVAGLKEAYGTVKAQGMELLYSLLGTGGSAIYQNTYHNIRDPLMAFTYSIPDPRTFEYDFLMAPRNKQELYDIWNIIKTLKFYGHMSIKQSGSDSVRYYAFPARFKIKYYTEGNENIWLGKTKVLGLTSVRSNIDTSNVGFIMNDFDNMSGNPPRIIALSMTFTELGILNREDINEGY